MKVFRVTFVGFECGLYSATSVRAVREFLEEFGVAESDIRAITEVRRVPLGCSVTEIGV